MIYWRSNAKGPLVQRGLSREERDWGIVQYHVTNLH